MSCSNDSFNASIAFLCVNFLLSGANILSLSLVEDFFFYQSGIWLNDERNWNRIFRRKQPKDVIVCHSWFWRSPNCIYDLEYYLEVQKNEDFQMRLLKKNSMEQITEEKALQILKNLSEHRPVWFAPKSIAEYEVWVCVTDPGCNFRIIVDRETGTLFLTDRQDNVSQLRIGIKRLLFKIQSLFNRAIEKNNRRCTIRKKCRQKIDFDKNGGLGQK